MPKRSVTLEVCDAGYWKEFAESAAWTRDLVITVDARDLPEGREFSAGSVALIIDLQALGDADEIRAWKRTIEEIEEEFSKHGYVPHVSYSMGSIEHYHRPPRRFQWVIYPESPINR